MAEQGKFKGMDEMANHQYDVVAMGNAIVDILAHVESVFLDKAGLKKGAMTLINEAQSDQLYELMGPATEVSGGSAANTAAGLASLGVRTAFIGKVCNDQLGNIFRHDIQTAGVYFGTKASVKGPSTARCMVFVTPDSHRTLQTYLGACVTLSTKDVPKTLIESAAITYLEGYLWDSPSAAAACEQAIDYAKKKGKKVSLSLSDPYCVDRHWQKFQKLCEVTDILFANDAEIMALWQTDQLAAAVEQTRQRVPLAAITQGAAGSLIITKQETILVKAAPVRDVVDTTGAGDLYAAGFLYGFVRGYPLKDCGAIASLTAAEIISHLGARPAVSLSKLLEDSRIIL